MEEKKGNEHGGMGQSGEPGDGGTGHLLGYNHDSSQVPMGQKSMVHYKKGDRNLHWREENLAQVQKVLLI